MSSNPENSPFVIKLDTVVNPFHWADANNRELNLDETLSDFNIGFVFMFYPKYNVTFLTECK